MLGFGLFTVGILIGIALGYAQGLDVGRRDR